MKDIFGYEKDKIDIVMFNMSTFYNWDRGQVNRNWNIMNALAKEEKINKIVAVDFLPVSGRDAIAHYLKNILLEVKTAEIIYGDLTSACYRRCDKIFAYTTIDSIFSFKIVARELRRIEKILNLRNVIFWSYNPMFVEFIGRLNEKLFVFDTVDNWAEHPAYTKLMRKKRLLKNYQTIARKADLIFTVSEELENFYKELGRTKDVFWVPNGVDWDHFNDSSKLARQNELVQINQPIIGYLGTIEARVDLDLIRKVAEAHSDKEVVLCGPIWRRVKPELRKKLGKIKNIRITGRIKFEDAPSYINNFAVAIIPHKINSFVKTMNPMKMYDYLACGKPVVSTPGAGTSMFKEHIYIAKNQQEFIKYIDQAIAENSAAREQARRTAVRPHSWRARTEKMMQHIQQKINL